MEYELTFVVSGASVDDEDAVDALEELDAMLFRGGGVDLLTLGATGDDPVSAARYAATCAVNAVPRLRVHRLDRNLVGIAEIAQRTGRSRQNVAQWVSGVRQADAAPFPPSEGTAGRSKVWLWSEVNSWLRGIGLDDGLRYPSRDEMTMIDHALLTTLTTTITFDCPDDEFASERDAIRKELERSETLLGLVRGLADNSGTLDGQGRHVIIIAGQSEPAADVMERVLSHGHDVVLMSMADRLFAATMTTKRRSKPTGLVHVPLAATMKEWVDLMWKNSNAAFLLPSSVQAMPQDAVFRDAA
ncbi:helix-turn-helix transcriptional regulator [Streptomyces sp. CA-111067]|uniref:helix-turn-helix transcriptional regulator n=1 Tax=Streptomyces sp. CA-111067 TaxID=3240046 RepID=UPI003D983449